MNELMMLISDNHILHKLIWTTIGIIFSILISKTINRILYSKIKDNKTYYNTRKKVLYTFTTIFIVYCIFLWSDSMLSLTTYFGLLSAGIAITLKDIFSNTAAWLFIVIRKPFEVGDRIIINEQRGDVIDIRMFQFTLIEVTSHEEGEQSTGRIIDIPNNYIFTNASINYSKAFKYIWNEIKVLITFESDWKKAKDILTDIVNEKAIHISKEASHRIREAERKYRIHYDKLTPIVYTNVRESGVELTLRYLCEPRQRRTSVNNIWEDILDKFALEENINLAYPTIRVDKK
ncbi:mechanosensitive ion channel family protein [Oceanirhabdus sp. W0125-5]|uniref:mechanosensitive ion channel family protein n=1 Tax=Oceanirhabdus sp. W0125-5 TaxID=2999116 RepID=UPI0022F33A6B|nr:mechanosensitive ion channel domain-containing protein [Oceanirhabdus sp. W0125-5]WBW97276.1 mechanosensitive ion channel [Oceanirhabdus sp. W0125-5]